MDSTGEYIELSEGMPITSAQKHAQIKVHRETIFKCFINSIECCLNLVQVLRLKTNMNYELWAAHGFDSPKKKLTNRIRIE